MVEDCRLLKAMAVPFVRARFFLYLLGLNALTHFIAPLQAQGLVVNTQDREAVRNFFNAVFYAGNGVAANWTGDLGNCDPGTTSAAYQDAVLRRINFYRAMAGVPADVTFDPVYSAKAAAAAAIVSANSLVTHSPTPGLSCYTEAGREAAESSNLALGTAGIDSIEAYIMDAGNNFRVGHRRWLLYPQTREMGNADIDPQDGSTTRRANANWIFDSNFGGPRPSTRDGFVAWPPPGFVPHRLVYPRWSFSFPGADFSQSTVNVTTNGTALSIHIENLAIGYGEETIVFVPGTISPDARRVHHKPASDLTYDINIANVIVGSTITNYSYTVTVFDSEKSLAPMPQLTGSSQPLISRTNRYRLPLTENASSYEFRVGTLLPYRVIENADAAANMDASVSSLYSHIQSSIHVSPPNAFHLAHTTPPRPQSLTLRNTIVPSIRSELRFQSRLGGASTGQVARAQISVDGGSSWRDLYTQSGDGQSGELNFTLRAVSLQPFAGRAVQFRFEYGFAFGGFNYVPGADPQIGWYIDDIQVTFAEELVGAQVSSATKPEFNFVPATAQAYFLDGRPRIFDFGGEWSPGKMVTALPPSAPAPSIQITSIRPTGNNLAVEFVAANATGSTIFQIERSSGLNGGWEVVPLSELELISSGGSFIYRLPNTAGPSQFFRVITD
jgi:hypothetical protein